MKMAKFLYMRQQATGYVKNLQVAAINTFLVVLYLVIMATEKDSNNDSFILPILVLIFSIFSIRCWIKGVKQYIDFRFQELEKKQ